MFSGAELRAVDADNVEIVRRADKTMARVDCEGHANDDNSSTSIQICLVVSCITP